MNGTHRISWPGLALAALTLVLVWWFGGRGWGGGLLALTVGALWAVSRWLEWRRPAPAAPVAPPPIDIQALALAAMTAVIEPSGLPMLIADRQRILAANAAARAALGAHIIGQDARIALRHPDAVALLEGSGAGTTAIRGLTSAGSLWQLTRAAIDAQHWLVELEDRSSQADIDRAHTDFVANASHELRTPLASIIGYVETLADNQGADAPAAMDHDTTQRFLGIVLREARRMQALVADLMSLSQLEAEKHDVPSTRIDLRQLTARVAGEFSGPGSPTDGRLILEREDGDIAVTGDVRQLEQALRNLIDNAFKYGGAGENVHVRLGIAARGTVRMAELAVTDRGPGIAPDHLPHLTRRFYRADPGRSSAAGSTGLGLAIVKHIALRHRGKLDIASVVGQGTVVTVRLPLAASELS